MEIFHPLSFQVQLTSHHRLLHAAEFSTFDFIALHDDAGMMHDRRSDPRPIVKLILNLPLSLSDGNGVLHRPIPFIYLCLFSMTWQHYTRYSCGYADHAII